MVFMVGIVFVPYRGFYFLNAEYVLRNERREQRFSSPIGAFIFLIVEDGNYIIYSDCGFRPLSGLLFS